MVTGVLPPRVGFPRDLGWSRTEVLPHHAPWSRHEFSVARRGCAMSIFNKPRQPGVGARAAGAALASEGCNDVV